MVNKVDVVTVICDVNVVSKISVVGVVSVDGVVGVDNLVCVDGLVGVDSVDGVDGVSFQIFQTISWTLVALDWGSPLFYVLCIHFQNLVVFFFP